MREQILKQIRDLTESRGGQPPGRRLFERETGMRQSVWRGVYWARWSDALVDAGFSPNAKNLAIDQSVFFEKLAAAFRHYGCVPTEAEFRMYAKKAADFPGHTTIGTRFPSKFGWSSKGGRGRALRTLGYRLGSSGIGAIRYWRGWKHGLGGHKYPCQPHTARACA